MSRPALRLIFLALVLCVAWFGGQKQRTPVSVSAPVPTANHAPASISTARQTWSHPDTLPDHFARHGADFGARDVEDYAAQAAAFLQRAKATGLPAKRDHDGSLRVYEAATDTFGAYNANGTTRTFFKPGGPTYFERQPGESIDLRAGR